jgi:hypothetical protein
MPAREALLMLALLVTACGGGTEDPGGQVFTPEQEAARAAAADPSQPPAEMTPTAMATDFDTVAARGERPLLREAYSWGGAGRDPFRPLNTIERSGPELPDLMLVSVIYQRTDPSRSIAVFRDVGSNRRYTVSPGDRIGGKLAVSAITTGSATLRMNDFGTFREQTYTIRQPMDVTP